MKARIVYRVDTDGAYVVLPHAEAERGLLADMVNAGRRAMALLAHPGATITCERTELASEPWVLDVNGETSSLTRREKEIAAFIVAGLRRGEIAEQCDFSPTTFDSHRLRIMHAMRCANEVQLTRLALGKGWVTL